MEGGSVMKEVELNILSVDTDIFLTAEYNRGRYRVDVLIGCLVEFWGGETHIESDSDFTLGVL